MSISLKAAAAALILLAPQVAFAHVTLEKPETAAGASYKGVLRVGHGCDGSPTTSLTVEIPDHVVAVKPMPKAGWKLSTVEGAYVSPVTLHGRKLEAGVRRITWSGGALKDAEYDEFVFAGAVSGDAPAGTLWFPVVQVCEKGENRWTDIPAAGQTARGLKSPAAALRITASAAAAQTLPSGSIRVEQAWSRATPGGSRVGAGYLRITNTGSTPDRLVAGTTDASERLEIHDMTVTDGVMKMRPLAEGIALAPGQTVELRPGGMHLMFMGLKKPLATGAGFTATLEFEKAGKMTVPFVIQPIGAGAPGSSRPAEPEMDHSQHHGHK
ncbi:MAG: DUF1775 domain-containing protein [Beijerinckiaceae bacterium]|nr:DUF1775 domain-containing protein [Beijerinckiaceae bacterium]